MKTFGFNMMQDMAPAIKVDGSYDAEKQLWLGEDGSIAQSNNTSTSCYNGEGCTTVYGQDTLSRTTGTFETEWGTFPKLDFETD